MPRILFATHENLEKTPVSRAMFLSIAEEVRSLPQHTVCIFSAGIKSVSVGDALTFVRRTQGRFDLASFRAALNALVLFPNAIRRVDLIVIRSYPAMILFSLIAKIYAKKILFDTRGLFFDELVDSGKISRSLLPPLMVIESLLLRLADRVVCVTTYQREHYCRKHRLPSKHFCVIPNGAYSHEVKTVTRTSADTVSLCYVGSLVRWHSPALMRDFCLSLVKKGLRFTLDVITEDLECAKRIFGSMSNARIYSHPFRSQPIRFDWGLCFISGGVSKAVCYPVKFNEYVAAGTKVLATSNVKVVTELIERYEFGISFAKADPELMASQFLEAIPQFRDRVPTLPLDLKFDNQLSLYKDTIRELC